MGNVGEDHPFPLTDTDRYVLSLTDEQYIKHDWNDLKNVIGECRCLSWVARLYSYSLN